MTKIIGVIGGKGGIGKTTLVSNLSSALNSIGHSVIAVDTNMTTPNLGLHLGLHLSPKTLHDVLKGKSKLNSATYVHPSGFRVIPGSMSINDLQGVDIGKLPSVVSGLDGKADFVLLDSAAGLGREAVSSLHAADEILIITNPDLPSVADALKTAKLAHVKNKKIIGVVVNRKRDKWHELTNSEVEEMLGHRVVAEIPEDRTVPKSISVKMPAVDFDPHSPASVEFRRLAHDLAGKEFKYKKPGRGFFASLVRWMTG